MAATRLLYTIWRNMCTYAVLTVQYNHNSHNTFHWYQKLYVCELLYVCDICQREFASDKRCEREKKKTFEKSNAKFIKPKLMMAISKLMH